MYKQYFWQGNHQIYGHTVYIYGSGQPYIFTRPPPTSVHSKRAYRKCCRHCSHKRWRNLYFICNSSKSIAFGDCNFIAALLKNQQANCLGRLQLHCSSIATPAQSAFGDCKPSLLDLASVHFRQKWHTGAHRSGGAAMCVRGAQVTWPASCTPRTMYSDCISLHSISNFPARKA